MFSVTRRTAQRRYRPENSRPRLRRELELSGTHLQEKDRGAAVPYRGTDEGPEKASRDTQLGPDIAPLTWTGLVEGVSCSPASPEYLLEVLLRRFRAEVSTDRWAPSP